MNPRREAELVVALDIGTDRVEAIIGEIAAEPTTRDEAVEPAKLRVVGVGRAPSNGLKKGVVVNIEKTTLAIQQAVREAEQMAEAQVHAVHTAISGAHLRAYNSIGVVAIQDGEVRPSDLDRVIDAARALAIPADQRILHVIPQEYILDKEGGIRDPIGMAGVRLEARVHLVTAAVSAIQNISKCVERCGLRVEGLTLASLASSHAVLTDDERDLGVCMVDIGAGTTDIAVWVNGALEHSAVLPVAGDQVTNDIAIALQTPTAYAEDIKTRYACALRTLANPAHEIEVPGVGDRPSRRLSRQMLASVVEPRYEELFEQIQLELRRAGVDQRIPTGVVLTGGAARMEGVTELAEEVFQRPVRIGSPIAVEGLQGLLASPLHATGVGLLRYAERGRPDEVGQRSRPPHPLRRLRDRIASWF